MYQRTLCSIVCTPNIVLTSRWYLEDVIYQYCSIRYINEESACIKTDLLVAFSTTPTKFRPTTI